MSVMRQARCLQLEAWVRLARPPDGKGGVLMSSRTGPIVTLEFLSIQRDGSDEVIVLYLTSPEPGLHDLVCVAVSWYQLPILPLIWWVILQPP